MKLRKYLLWCLPLAFLFAIVACEKNDTSIPADPLAGLHKITETFIDGSKVALYSTHTSLSTGYNRLFFHITDSVTGAVLEDAQVSVMPMMDMGMMQHSSPVEGAQFNTGRTAYASPVVFTMPSTTTGSWWLDVSFTHPVSHVASTATLPITVVEGINPHIFQSEFDNERFIVALVEPSSPKVGINDLELAIYKQATMMSYPADSSLTITFEPEMPSMGHGSPNNVNPLHVGKGHYTGKVNFTMTGFWRLNLDIMAGTEVADTTGYIDITF